MIKELFLLIITFSNKNVARYSATAITEQIREVPCLPLAHQKHFVKWQQCVLFVWPVTCYHILYVISVSRAVNVPILSRLRLIGHEGRVNRDSPFLFLGWGVDLFIRLNFSLVTLRENLGYSSCQCCLSVINVPNCSNVHYRFVANVNFFPTGRLGGGSCISTTRRRKRTGRTFCVTCTIFRE